MIDDKKDNSGAVALVRALTKLLISFTLIVASIVLFYHLPSLRQNEGLQILVVTKELRIEAVMVLFALFPTCIAARNLWGRILKKRTSKFQLYLLLFCIPFWCLFFGIFGIRYGQIISRIYKFSWKNEVYHIMRITQCRDNNGLDCDNKLIVKNEGAESAHVMKTMPKGEDMKFHNGFLFFHQYGCCDDYDVVTVIDMEGKVEKKCGDENTSSEYPMTDKAWEKLYNCKPLRKAEW